MPVEEKVQDQPQVTDGVPQSTEPGAETPQATDRLPEPAEPGAEKEPEGETPAKAERTYTEAEFTASGSKKDQEIAEGRKALAYQALQWEIKQAQAAEAQAQAADRQAVDTGEISPQEAAQKQQERMRQYQQGLASRQQQQAAHQLLQQAESVGRVMAAQDFGAKYGVDPKDLLADKDLSTPDKMEAKAVKLALEKTQGELKATKAKSERFDSGVVSTSGESDLSKLSATDLFRKAYAKKR